jgi:murein DD-endopeptidase MepM/ murein hydrolase activator NlpD
VIDPNIRAPRRSRGRLRAILLVVALAAVAAAAVATFRVGGVPEIAIDTDLPGIGRHTTVTAVATGAGRGVARLTVEVVQGDHAEIVATRAYPTRPPWSLGGGGEPARLEAEVGAEALDWLRQGEAVVRVSAERAGTWLRHPPPATAELTLPVRLQPPSLAVVSTQHYVAQGGSGVVVYRVGPAAETSGVRAGSWWFEGYPLPGGGEGERFALFGIPYDLGDRAGLRLVAADILGNEASVEFVDQFKPKPYAEDTIRLEDGFIERVVPEIVERTPDFEARATALETYLAINGELRARNDRQLRELAAGSRPEILWHRPFLPMRNAQVMSPFAAHRTYLYDGEPVDEQFHLGFDLASVRRAPIEAANDGVVALAGFFGIYGNAVILDHGCGLASLYGHLSSIEVEEGQRVERGQEIGRSGQTGLAGGDHLHFAMLVGGLPVTPVEWWDPHWLRDRVAAKLGPEALNLSTESSPSR